MKKLFASLRKYPLVKRWTSWETTTKALVLSVAAALVVIVVVVAMVLWPSQPQEETTLPLETPTYRHPLTGAVLDAPVTTLPAVFAVMIENSADAWPLAGLDEAFLVIEAPVEAAIPRFVAFFSEEVDVAKIGPVRSARPYYLDWAAELDAVYAHVGGSPEALDLIAQFGIIDLNEFFQGEYFYRDERTRYAPHNAYTTSDDLRASLEELDFDAPSYDAWTFADGAPGCSAGKSLSIDWTSGNTYDLDWFYDAATNVYMRNQRDVVWFLEGVKTAMVENVVVMATDVEIVDATGRRHIRTVGDGAAYVFQNGCVTVATWEKDDRMARLRFYDEAGSEIAMNAGQTWIEVVESLGQVTITDAVAAE